MFNPRLMQIHVEHIMAGPSPILRRIRPCVTCSPFKYSNDNRRHNYPHCSALTLESIVVGQEAISAAPWRIRKGDHVEGLRQQIRSGDCINSDPQPGCNSLGSSMYVVQELATLERATVILQARIQ
jgi:hypothetical protein